MQAITCAIRRYSPLLLLSSSKRHLFTACLALNASKINVAPYLLDRTKPADDILSNLTPDDAQRLSYIKAEHSMLVARGKNVPLNLTPDEYLELLACPSHSARNKYYLFRYKVSKKKESRKAKKLNKPADEVKFI